MFVLTLVFRCKLLLLFMAAVVFCLLSAALTLNCVVFVMLTIGAGGGG